MSLPRSGRCLCGGVGAVKARLCRPRSGVALTPPTWACAGLGNGVMAGTHGPVARPGHHHPRAGTRLARPRHPTDPRRCRHRLAPPPTPAISPQGGQDQPWREKTRSSRRYGAASRNCPRNYRPPAGPRYVTPSPTTCSRADNPATTPSPAWSTTPPGKPAWPTTSPTSPRPLTAHFLAHLTTRISTGS
jgi:hypothetical protein